MKVKPLDCVSEKTLLSKSGIGEVWQCKCCDTFMLNMGRLTFYLSSIDMVVPTEILLASLERAAEYDFIEKGG